MATTPADTSIADQLLAQAKFLARQGFRVFPLEVDGNTPAHEGWQDHATADENTAASLWQDPFGAPVPYNIGIATGRGLTVLDVDVKNGQPGAESLDELVTFLGLEDDTYTVRTRSGGLHLYYGETKTPLRNSVGQVRPGLDIRSDGGFVVAPGSSVNGLAWSVEKDLPVKPIAPWFAEMCGRRAEKSEHSTTPLVELDTPEAIERAVAWLKLEAPETIADSGNGDWTAYKVACHVKDFGISEGECLGLILEHYNGVKSHPALATEVWETKVSNAYRHGLNAPGILHPMADFKIEELEERQIDAHGLSPSMRQNNALPEFDTAQSIAFRTAARRPYVVKGMLGAGMMSLLFGTTNVGKTFVMLDVALHVATGRPWNGRRTRQSPVVYVAAEGTFDIHDRVAAWVGHNGIDPKDSWLTLVPSPVDLRSNTADLKRIVEITKRKAAQYGGEAPPLVVVDTFSRAMAGGDENATADVGLVVKHLDAIRFATGAHVAIVHHSGKDVSKGSRGSTVLPYAVDTEIELHDGEMRMVKQRAGAKADATPYTLKTITLGHDEEGDPITSCVALFGAAAEMTEAVEPVELSLQQQEWLLQLEEGIGELAAEAGKPPHAFAFGWKQAEAVWQAKSPEGARPGWTDRTARQGVTKRLRVLEAGGAVFAADRGKWTIVPSA